MNNSLCSSSECCELAAHLLGLAEKLENGEIEEYDVWEELTERHDLDNDGFCWLINKLVPMIDIGESVILKKRYKGFSRPFTDEINEFIIKVEIKEGVEVE